MGVVYAAYDPELDRKVALKLVLPGIAGASTASAGHSRLLREAQALAKLSHPNVVAIHDVGIAMGRVWIAMEFVECKTLGEWTKERPDEPAIDRLQHHNKRYFRLDGVEVAMNWNDLTDGALLAPISVTNAGSSLPNAYVWTNTDPVGGVDSFADCGDWTAGVGGRVGFSGLTGNGWTAAGETHACTNLRHLYCFEQLPEEN